MLLNKLKLAVICITLTGTYFFAARLGLTLAFEQVNTSPVWPPTGIAIAALLYFGIRVWPGIFAGAVLTNLFINTPILVSIEIAAGNTLEAIVAFILISHFSNRYPLSKVTHVIIFVSALVFATMISATAGVYSLTLAGLAEPSNFSLLWTTWWLGDLVGGLVVTPLLLTWVKKPSINWSSLRTLEAMTLIVISTTFFFAIFSDLFFIVDSNYPLTFLALPSIIIAVFRFQQHGATLLVAALSIVAIFGTIDGNGPFVGHTANESLLLLQSFIAVIVLTVLIIAASNDERKATSDLLIEAQNNLENRVQKRTQEINGVNLELKKAIERSSHSSEAMTALLAATAVSDEVQFFRACAKDLANIYGARYAFIGIFDEKNKNTIKTVTVWADDDFGDNFCYNLEGTPCKDVLDLNMELIPSGAATSYPEDEMLVQMGIESYLGAPLISPDQKMKGLVAVMHNEPFMLDDWIKPVLGIYANRIALELERKEANDELQLAASVFKESIDAVVICDANNTILRVNPAFTRITGYSFEEVCGQKPSMLQSGHHSKEFYEEFWSTLMREGVWQGELWDRQKNGKTFPIWQTVTIVRDNAGEIKQYISIFSDITEKKLTEERIYHLAHYDILTELPNRTAFLDLLYRALQQAQRQKEGLALLFMDLDNFKLINDTSGHQIGDELLKHVALRIKDIVREVDTVARLGGDEFTVLLPSISSVEDAVIVAEKILNCFSKPFQLEHSEVIVSTSIGISTYPNDGEDAATLLKNADVAMYKAKQKGRNNFQFFTMEMNNQAMERLNIENALRKGLENEEFELYYQPQINIKSGEIIGCEALIRWHHPEKGLVPPDQFIPVAEECGLIAPLGEWVLNEACQQCVEWHQNGYSQLHVAVNLSARQFMKQDLLQIVKKAIDSSGVIATNLELELTESMVMEYVDESIETLHALRALGVQLSIDDFGTGYSSMAYLKKFPLNKLKIDRSFVADLAFDPDDAAIVSATIALGHSLNLKVVAEGVETKQQLQFLEEHGCEEVQGYYFSKPIPANELDKLLSETKKDSENFLTVNSL